MRLKFTIFIFL